MISWDYESLSPSQKKLVDAQTTKKEIGLTNFITPKESKMGNKKVTIDCHTFHSMKEGKRYNELMLMVKSGDITELILQPKFVLLEKFTDGMGNKHREIAYFADFKYKTKEGVEIIEDVKPSKSFTSDVYKLKKKLLLNKYREIKFKEIY